MAEGIRKRHSKNCSAREGGRCNCKAGYEAWVFSRRDGKKIRRTFAREAEAKSWRADALGALARGGLRAARPITLDEAWRTWHQGAVAGAVTNRSGDVYKRSALRSYEQGMRLRVLPEFGAVRLSELHRPDLQEFADRLLAEGLNPSTIQVTILPLRAIFRRALSRGELAVNPCNGLQLPAVRGRRERYATPAEAAALIAAVPATDRPVWATAMYAGLRRGELQALRAEDVDLANGVIRVEFGWEYRDGQIPLKSNAGRRKVPIPAVLRSFLETRFAACGYSGADRLFAFVSAASPFDPGKLTKRADRAWATAGLERITLHECRHTFASLMIAAGVNPKALQSFMGHANISITLDHYGHLMPGSEAEAAGLLDAYLKSRKTNE
ncbi:MAG TPA: site-specific integrase [Solirubrobacterales bacterium]|nr:site-specific integrase [Solirubrobacterales bacterium]